MTLVPAAPTSPIRRGEIYWAVAPRPDLEGEGEEPAAAVAHPHVIVQDDVLNDSRLPTVVVVALTSNRRRASEPGNVLLEAGEAGLDKASVVVVSQVSSIAKAALGACIGQLSPARLEQIFDGMRFVQALQR